jgi:N-acetylneuraminic acid mutarotase
MYDPIENTWTTVAQLHAYRDGHTATLLPDGKVLVTGGSGDAAVLSNSEVYDEPTAGSWTNVASLNTARESHTATLMPSGKVLIAGGIGPSGYLASVEVYDPSLNTWANVASLNIARSSHTATLLSDGKVLVAGGQTTGGNITASTEIYDPSKDTWTSVAAMNIARTNHTATLLPSGKVLVAGGYGNGGNDLSSVEVYDPVVNTWTHVAWLNTDRRDHTATLLPSGKVLVVGGFHMSGGWVYNTEVYDPEANTWTTVATMNLARRNHTATLMPNGKVLIAAGEKNDPTCLAEVYDPEMNTWTTVAMLNNCRTNHTAVLLPSGRILVAGGSHSGPWPVSTEVYDPCTNTWTNNAPINTPRVYHTATLLASGKVLVVGGESNGILASAEVYDQGLGFDEGWRPTVSTISSPLTLGNSLSLVGSGYRGYKYTEASGGGTNNSTTNYPIVQIQRMDNEQWLWVSPNTFNSTAFTSLPVTNILAGPALVTVFANGIPSISHSLNLNYATSVSLSAPDILYHANGVVTVTVSSSQAIPAGTVSLSVDNGVPISQNLEPVYASSQLQATTTFILTTPSVGVHTLSVSYVAQANFTASSTSGTLTVKQDSPTPTSTSTSTATQTATPTKTPTLTPTPTPKNRGAYLPLINRPIPPTLTPTPLPTPPTTEPPPPPTTEPPPPSNTGNVVITTIFYHGVLPQQPDEYVEIKNNDTFSIQLANWTLEDIAHHTFKFPSFVIQSGQVCRIYTNQSHPELCGFNYGNGSPIWNDTGGDCGYLRDSSSTLINQFCY